MGWKPRSNLLNWSDLVDADLELMGMKSPGEGRKIIRKNLMAGTAGKPRSLQWVNNLLLLFVSLKTAKLV